MARGGLLRGGHATSGCAGRAARWHSGIVTPGPAMAPQARPRVGALRLQLAARAPRALSSGPAALRRCPRRGVARPTCNALPPEGDARFEGTSPAVKGLVSGLTGLLLAVNGGGREEARQRLRVGRPPISPKQLHAGIREDFEEGYLWTGIINEVRPWSDSFGPSLRLAALRRSLGCSPTFRRTCTKRTAASPTPRSPLWGCRPSRGT
eukprot:scaffold4409_cov369-Prasinococcus_capsulatus_cf.AAC.14